MAGKYDYRFRVLVCAYHSVYFNVKDVNGRIFTVYGTRENDEEVEFLLYYKECREWFWQKSIEYTPYIKN